MPDDFVMCARSLTSDNQNFGTEPAGTRYLFVPDGQLPKPAQEVAKKTWADALVAKATRDVQNGAAVGDILVFVHGYANDQDIVMRRHRRLRDDLAALGWDGVVVSFDWPSENDAAAYLVDRHNAIATALQLVSDGIELLCTYQQPNCKINIHLLAHSMGALVVREAFDDADNSGGIIGTSNWTASQVVFIAGDVSMGSLSANDRGAHALYRHSIRLTNYSNSFDDVLALSNVKRVGVAPRAGRHGLPDDSPVAAVNVDCSNYYLTIPEDQPVIGTRSHSWHIGDPVFTKDLYLMLSGVDRASVPTRKGVPPPPVGRFELIRPV